MWLSPTSHHIRPIGLEGRGWWVQTVCFAGLGGGWLGALGIISCQVSHLHRGAAAGSGRVRGSRRVVLGLVYIFPEGVICARGWDGHHSCEWCPDVVDLQRVLPWALCNSLPPACLHRTESVPCARSCPPSAAPYPMRSQTRRPPPPPAAPSHSTLGRSPAPDPWSPLWSPHMQPYACRGRLVAHVITLHNGLPPIIA